jgi:multiple sugar transport system permease protein
MSAASTSRRPALLAARVVIMLLLLAVTLLPVYWILSTSIRPDAEVLRPNPTLWPERVTFDHYREIVASGRISFYLGNSLAVAFGSTALALILGAPAAYALTRFRYPGSLAEQVRLWMLSTRFIPPFAIVIPIFLLFRDLKLLDTRTGLLLAHAVFSLPFALWLLISGFEQIPREIEEAALVDGSSRWRAFLTVALPLAAPTLAATAIFALLLSWNEFLFALLLTASKATTMPVYISQFVTDRSLQWGQIAASAAVASLPVIAFLLFAQRYLVRGLTMGAAK